jgi:hypothetical protein
MASIAKLVLLDEVITASKDGGSVSLQQSQVDFVGHLKISSYSAGTFVGKIQHSPDLVDWFDLVTFSSLTENAIELKFPTTPLLGHVRASIAASSTPDARIKIELHYRTSK